MTESIMTCDVFDELLPDYMEGTLIDVMRSQLEQHLKECVRCAGLVRDLENIQKEAAALPNLVPSRDLWSGIESRISAPVIPLVARQEKPRRWAPAWMGVAAAALVVTTAGVTYTLTERALDSRGAAATVPRGSLPAAILQNPPVAATSLASEPPIAASPDGKRPGSDARSFREDPSTELRREIPVTAVSQTDQRAPSHSEVVYGKEIAMLQAIVSQRKTQLDSSTVAVIERNLQIIDAAIEQSRAALAKDPASMMLSQQLSHALDKKVELLRTAVMLPANT
jgi:hypothetical protein